MAVRVWVREEDGVSIVCGVSCGSGIENGIEDGNADAEGDNSQRTILEDPSSM